MCFIHQDFCAEDRVPVGTRSVAENRGEWNSIFTAKGCDRVYRNNGWEEIYHMPYQQSSLYCISVFDFWFFHSEYSVKLCLGKAKCPWPKPFPKYLQHKARRAETFTQKHVLMLKGYVYRHVVKDIPRHAGKIFRKAWNILFLLNNFWLWCGRDFQSTFRHLFRVTSLTLGGSGQSVWERNYVHNGGKMLMIYWTTDTRQKKPVWYVLLQNNIKSKCRCKTYYVYTLRFIVFMILAGKGLIIDLYLK